MRKVGTSTRFGVGEGNPQDITGHKGKLLMVGAQTDRMYDMNLTTGVGVRVGTVNQFGVGAAIPAALASNNSTALYMGDRTTQTTSTIYTVDDTTSQGTQFRIFPRRIITMEIKDNIMYYTTSGRNGLINRYNLNTRSALSDIIIGTKSTVTLANRRDRLETEISAVAFHGNDLLFVYGRKIGRYLPDVAFPETNFVDLGTITKQGGGFPITQPSGLASLVVPTS